MNPRTKLSLIGLVFSLAIAPHANAGLIIQSLAGGVNPDPLGGYDMSGFAVAPAPGPVTESAPSLDTGDVVLFAGQDMTTPLPMTVEDPAWWDYAHGNIYSTNDSNYITLILPENTRAFSFWVGADIAVGQNNNAWFRAYSETEVTDKEFFRVDRESTQGFGVYSSDGCSAITKIVVEPPLWGVGNFSINQGTCSEVPEPGSVSLLGAGLLGLGLMWGLRRRRPGITNS